MVGRFPFTFGRDTSRQIAIELGTLNKPIQEGVKIAEMLLLRPDGRLWMIEAKSSSPRPENNPDFQTFLDEITSKFVNTLNLYFAARLGRHDAQRLDWPPAFAHVDASTAVLLLILVIHGHKAEWLSPIAYSTEGEHAERVIVNTDSRRT